MNEITVNKVIEGFNFLPLEDKEYVIDILEKQMIELKRESIVSRSENAMKNYNEGMVKKGTVKDLYEDLESD